MKKHIFVNLRWRYLVFVGIFFITFSCDEKLETQPQGVLDPLTVVSSAENIDNLIIGVYGMLNGYNPSTGSAWQTSVTNWVYGDITSDDAYKGSELTDQGPALEIEMFSHTESNSYFNAKWRALYEGVKRSNDALRALNNSEFLSADAKAERIAEVRFLRGHFYFDLKKIFDNVPYLDENSETFFVKNFGGEELTWAHIEADFQSGIDNLPTTQAQSGRPIKAAAYAYLGKALLYQSKFSEAKTAFDWVVNSNAFSLVSEYEAIYDPSKKAENTETVFVVHHSIGDGAAGDANGDYGSILSYIQGGPGGCCGFYVPTQDIVNAHKTQGGLPLLPSADGIATHNAAPVNSDYGIPSDAAFSPYTGEVDPRLDFNIGRRGIPFKDWGVHPGTDWARDPVAQGVFSQKKRFIRKDQDAFAGNGAWGEQTTAIDYHIIRYADVLLMLAEAEVEIGSLSRATELVNMVRERAKNSSYIQNEAGNANAANYSIELYPDFISQDIARRAVRFERRLELSFEGHRFFDLVRWGIAKARIDDYKAFESSFNPNGTGYIPYISNINFTVGKNEYFPIPAGQIDLSSQGGEATLQQNPGY